jgi:hypothetical protein
MGMVPICAPGPRALLACSKVHALFVCSKVHALFVCSKVHALFVCSKVHALFVCSKVHALFVCSKVHALFVCREVRTRRLSLAQPPVAGGLRGIPDLPDELLDDVFKEQHPLGLAVRTVHPGQV